MIRHECSCLRVFYTSCNHDIAASCHVLQCHWTWQLKCDTMNGALRHVFLMYTNLKSQPAKLHKCFVCGCYQMQRSGIFPSETASIQMKSNGTFAKSTRETQKSMRCCPAWTTFIKMYIEMQVPQISVLNMTAPIWKDNNFRKSEWSCTKFCAIMHDNFPTKLLQFPHAKFNNFVWPALITELNECFLHINATGLLNTEWICLW